MKNTMQVPSLWDCSMNKDVLLNSCDKGSSEEWVEASANMVIAAKFKLYRVTLLIVLVHTP